MERHTSSVWLAIFYFALTCGWNSNMEKIKISSGPMMCTKLCQKLADFIGIKEFHCQRIPSHGFEATANGPGEKSLVCLKTDNASIVNVVEGDHCGDFSKGAVNDPAFAENNPSIILLKACEEGNLMRINYLLSKGLVDINVRDRRGRTPVMVAVSTRHLAVFDYLVCMGCDLAALDHTNNILHIACKDGNIDLVKRIVSKTIFDIDSRGEDGTTPVMYAAYSGQIDVFEFLTRKGCNVKAVSNVRNNVLHWACEGGKVHMVKHILSNKIFDVESRGEHGKTPVMIAAGHGTRDVFDLCVNKSCNLTGVDDDNFNILHLACKGGHVGMVKHIVSLNLFDIDIRGRRERSPILIAALFGSVDVFDFLMKRKCNLTVVDYSGANILHLACLHETNLRMIQFILSKQIVDIDSGGHRGRTPVMYAASRGFTDAVKLLDGYGCNMTATDDEGSNILHVASSRSRFVKLVKYLMKRRVLKGKEKEKNNFGKTPVQEAEYHGNTQIAELLKAGFRQ